MKILFSGLFAMSADRLAVYGRGCQGGRLSRVLFRQYIHLSRLSGDGLLFGVELAKPVLFHLVIRGVRPLAYGREQVLLDAVAAFELEGGIPFHVVVTALESVVGVQFHTSLMPGQSAAGMVPSYVPV